MENYVTEIDYDKLISKHLKGVVIDALKIASEQGLPGENHYYITFKTDFAGVEIPQMLKVQYPDSMTIVLQHQFSNLEVDKEKFSVVLTFGGVPHLLVIPFDSISYFADPYAKFGLSFNFEDTEKSGCLEDMEIEEENASPVSHAPAEVISIDSFRKK